MEKTILQAPIEGMRDFEVVKVDEETRKEVSHGRVFDRDRLKVEKKGPWALIGHSGELLAVYKEYGEKVKPAVVIVDPCFCFTHFKIIETLKSFLFGYLFCSIF